ncbi:MAG: hypothetical protein GY948_16660 [Alphaproteobacteria bacterium]|nr:hypothetical protein [Alphaproteobacteria bacterium]
MTSSVTVPVWLFLVLSLCAVLVLFRVVVFPLWARFWGARTRKVVEKINPLLQLHLSPFSLSRRRVLADRLLRDRAVEAGIEEIASDRGDSVEKTQREAWRIAWDIVPAFNPYFYFRIGFGMARRCLRSLYKFRVAFEDKASMADVSDKAAVVFIIHHRSNIDYAVVNYLTVGRTVLSFGVGEWSRVWPIQPLMRMAGGYFVRRDSGDPLYRLMLKRYVQLATEARVPHAVFLEGQLSPDGRVGTAKLGLLSYVTEHFDVRHTPDLIFMPVGINYDRIPEDENLQRFSSEEFRAKGRKYVLLQGAQFSIRVVWEMLFGRRPFGYACAKFGKPISFAAWLKESDVTWRELNREQRFAWVSKLGSRLIAELTTLVPATPVAVLCRIWFEDPSLVIDRTELGTRFNALCTELKQGGCHVVLVGDKETATLEHALKLATSRRIILKNQDGLFHLNAKKRALAVYNANALSQFLERK